MTPPTTPVSFRAAPLIHGALVLSSIIGVGVVWFLRGGLPMVLLPQARVVLSYAGYGVTGALVLVEALLWTRVTGFERGMDPDAWWAANRARLVALWALAEGSVLIGAVFWLLTDSQMLLLVLAGNGLFVLASSRPRKFMEL